jgi:thioredoxin reductase (NADPH)
VLTRDRERVETPAVFVLIGGEPRTDWLSADVEREERGYILTGDAAGQRSDGSLPQTLETSMAGVFAVGDVRNGSMKRIAAAVGEGSTAIRKVHEYLRARQTPPDVPDLVAAATDDAVPDSG